MLIMSEEMGISAEKQKKKMLGEKTGENSKIKNIQYLKLQNSRDALISKVQMTEESVNLNIKREKLSKLKNMEEENGP